MRDRFQNDILHSVRDCVCNEVSTRTFIVLCLPSSTLTMSFRQNKTRLHFPFPTSLSTTKIPLFVHLHPPFPILPNILFLLLTPHSPHSAFTRRSSLAPRHSPRRPGSASSLNCLPTSHTNLVHRYSNMSLPADTSASHKTSELTPTKWTSGDFTLISSDNHIFKVDSYYLQAAS